MFGGGGGCEWGGGGGGGGGGVYDFATSSGIDRPHWRSSQQKGSVWEGGAEKRDGEGENLAERDGWEESVPAKANRFGRDNKTRCPAETENVIRANGSPNTPQVHGADGSVIVGSII